MSIKSPNFFFYFSYPTLPHTKGNIACFSQTFLVYHNNNFGYLLEQIKTQFTKPQQIPPFENPDCGSIILFNILGDSLERIFENENSIQANLPSSLWSIDGNTPITFQAIFSNQEWPSFSHLTHIKNCSPRPLVTLHFYNLFYVDLALQVHPYSSFQSIQKTVPEIEFLFPPGVVVQDSTPALQILQLCLNHTNPKEMSLQCGCINIKIKGFPYLPLGFYQTIPECPTRKDRLNVELFQAFIVPTQINQSMPPEEEEPKPMPTKEEEPKPKTVIIIEEEEYDDTSSDDDAISASHDV